MPRHEILKSRALFAGFLLNTEHFRMISLPESHTSHLGHPARLQALFRKAPLFHGSRAEEQAPALMESRGGISAGFLFLY